MSVFTNSSSGAAEQAAAYVSAILGLLGSQDPMSVLRETPAALGRAVAGMPAAQLPQREKPGKWSIAHVLQHLADSEVVWSWRMRLILAQDRPMIIGYDQDQWADNLHYGEVDPFESLDTFSVLRRGNLRLLERASPEDLKRVGIHAERGEESVEHLRRLYAGHDLMHLQQIARVRRAVSAS
jgi:DinB superfamily